MPRWTERERTALIGDLRDQIELVWMTGELHLEKPTVQHEVSRGLHFFDETLFEMAPEMLALIDGALERYYPGRNFELPPFFQFGSWIGGDRDGNPSVTTRVTGWTLRQNALAALRHYSDPHQLSRPRSVDHRARAAGAADFQAELCRALGGSGEADAIAKRNPGEPYRQYLSSCCASSTPPSPASRAWISAAPVRPISSADELIQDLRVIELALQQANSPSIAADLVRPVRRVVEMFRFSTVRLDLRENTTKTTAALQALWWATAGHGDDSPPELGSRDWRAWLFRGAGPALDRPAFDPRASRRGDRADRHVRASRRDQARGSTATRSARSSCR